MASNNNPETTTPTAPAVVPPTMVTITESNGTQFSADLHDISAEDAAKLYDALGHTGTKTNYQELANQVAGFAHNFKSIVSIGLPAGMGYQEALTNFMKSLKEGGGKIKDDSAQYLKDFENTSFGQSVTKSGIWRTAEGTAAAVAAMARFTSGLGKPFDTASALWDATTGTAGEVASQISFGMSEAQAKAMGTAYAAALYMNTDAPGKAQEANLLDKGMAHAESMASNVWHMLPPSMAAFFTAVGKFISNGISGKGFDWDVAYKEAVTEVTADTNKPVLSYEETLARDMASKIDKSHRPEAADLLEKAEHVAGVDTKPIAAIVHEGGVFRDTDGAYKSLNFENGAPKTDTLKDAKGQPLTLAHRLGDSWQAVKDAAMPDSKMEFAGEATAAAATVALEKTRLAPIRGASNLAVTTVAGAAKLGTSATLGVISGVSRSTAAVAGAVLPSSAAPMKQLSKNVDIVDRAGEQAAKDAAKLGAKNHLTGDALTAMVNEAREAARDAAAKRLAPRSAFSRSLDSLRPAGDAMHDLGTGIQEGTKGLSAWVRGGIDTVKEHLSFDRRTPAKKEADIVKADAKKAAEAAMGNVAKDTVEASQAAHAETIGGKVSTFFSTKVSPNVPTWLGGSKGKQSVEIAETTVKADAAATHATQTAESVVHAAEAAKVEKPLGWAARKATGIAETLIKLGKPGKLAAAGILAIAGVTVTGAASAKEIAKDMTGVNDFEKGDYVRATTQASGFFKYISVLPLTDAVDLNREIDAQYKVDAKAVAQLDTLLETQTKKTGNVYIDRVIELKAMLKRGVTEVALEPDTTLMPFGLGHDNRGAIAHEGKVIVAIGAEDSSIEQQATVKEAIDMNLRLFVVKGGSLATAQALLKPAAVAMTNKELVAAHEGIIEQARMAVNRVTGETKLAGFNLGIKANSVAIGSTITPSTNGSAAQATQQAALA